MFARSASKDSYPQGYISMREASAACREAGKRLCKDDEWVSACKGKEPKQYPYGDEHVAGYCNDNGISPLRALYPYANERSTFAWYKMNDPQAQPDSRLARQKRRLQHGAAIRTVSTT